MVLTKSTKKIQKKSTYWIENLYKSITKNTSSVIHLAAISSSKGL